MKTLLLTILGASIANTITFLLYQGFVQSYWGRNIREEVTRWFDQLQRFFGK